MKESLKFSVDSALLSELGEKLVQSVHIALAELVKNSYDADATDVKIEFIEDDTGINEIRIIDNGYGMNFYEVKNYWMRIATTIKVEKNTSLKYGRPKTGAKGIGRFCCRRLGRSLKVVTTGWSEEKKEYQKTDVSFPWEDFKSGTDVTEIECPGEQEIIKKSNTGTALIIRDIIDEWNIKGYNYLKRQLAVLAANKGEKREGFTEDPGFNITIQAPQFEEGTRDIREDLINAGWGTLSAYINKKKQAVCELNAMGIGRKRIVSKTSFPKLNNIKMKLGIFPLNKKQMRDTSILSKGSLREILPHYGGVQIRYKGFRVYPYGDDDWLHLDRDRGLRKLMPKDELIKFAQSLEGINPRRSLINMLSMRGYMGSVDIYENATGFKLKINREGFIETDSFIELKRFVRFAIEWATIYRDYYIRMIAKENADAAREYLEEKLDKPIEPHEVVESAVKYIQEEITNITSLLEQPEKTKVEESVFKATEVILKHEESNKKELEHLRIIASTSMLLLIFSHEVKHVLSYLDTLIMQLSMITRKLQKEDASEIIEIQNEINNAKLRFEELLMMTSNIGIDSRKEKPANLALKDRIENVKKILKLVLSKYNIIIDDKDVPNNIIIKNIFEAELYAILLNLLSNSIKSIIAAKNEKKIKIKAERINEKIKITFYDTGLGLHPAYFEEVFVPFISDPEGKLYNKLEKNLNPEDKYIVGTGTGLGLSIIKEIIKAHNGSISFQKPEKNWKTKLEVILL